MIYILNIAIVILGLPLVGASFVLFGLFHPRMRNEIGLNGFLQMGGLWIISFGLFSLVYQYRANWLKTKGILKSWKLFDAFFKENHLYPEVSDEGYEKFYKWLEPPREMRVFNASKKEYNDAVKMIYQKIQTEIEPNERCDFIYCLLRYLKDGPKYWVVHSSGGNPVFFKSLYDLLPENSIVYAESLYDKEVQQELSEISSDCKNILPSGTLFPTPEVFHIPATEMNLNRLAELSEEHVISVHFHAYKDDEFILIWHDAFEENPLYVSKVIPEDRIIEFCERVNVEYEDETYFNKIVG